jgi:hypothetical protein
MRRRGEAGARGKSGYGCAFLSFRAERSEDPESRKQEEIRAKGGGRKTGNYSACHRERPLSEAISGGKAGTQRAAHRRASLAQGRQRRLAGRPHDTQRAAG